MYKKLIGILIVSSLIISSFFSVQLSLANASATPTPTPTPTATPPKILVLKVSLNKKSVSIIKGKTFILIPAIKPSNSSNKKVTWKSSKKAIATVSSTGRVKGIKKGTAYITAVTVEGKKSARCKVVVILSTRAAFASQILKSKKIALARVHPSGVVDGAFAYNNILDTSKGWAAKRSCYGTAPGGKVFLSTNMLKIIVLLSKKYSFRISEIAGAGHSSGSNHYKGIAFDLDRINGQHASSSSSRNGFISLAKKYGLNSIVESSCVHFSYLLPFKLVCGKI